MKKTLLTIGCAALLLMTACKNKNNMENPFLAAFPADEQTQGQWNTPYNIPDFKKIKPEHYMPAFEEGIKRQKAEIDAIVNNSEAPTFANTIEALEQSGALLNEVSGVFFNLAESNNSKEMEKIAEGVSPKLAAHGDDIMLNAKLFERVKTVYDQRESLGLTGEQLRLTEETYKNFVRNGAHIPADKQERFREINSLLASLTLRFGNNVLKATNYLTLGLREDQVANLGLTADQLAAAKEAAEADSSFKEAYKFTLHMPSWEPFMQNCNNRDMREIMWSDYTHRCVGADGDNLAIIDSIVNLRLERAQILGFESHAAYTLDDCLAKTPEAVYKCLMDLWEPALKKAKQERDEYQKMLEKDHPGEKLQPWDWRYYCEKLRKERYALNEDEIRPYFSLDNVREGAFNVANKLYGLTFRENNKLPKYHPDAVSYEVLDGDKVIAILYMDFFPRESKRSGAWMTNFREQSYTKDGKKIIPLVSLVLNFTKPSGDKPSLLNFDETTTLFHEFGHSLHSILSDCRYESLSGTNVSRDFVELPSQVMEQWAGYPEVMKMYAKHYKTGEVIPDSLINKIEAASTYGQGFINTELIAASLLDMAYANISEPTEIKFPDFEDAEMQKIGLIPEIISRYRSTYFQHVFSGGYSAGYYGYTWAAVLDNDAFEAFKENGVFDKKTADAFRYNVLQNGNTEDAMVLYKRFRGQEPSIEPLLKNRGLK